MSEEPLKLEDFEEILDLGNVIIIPPKTEIKIACAFSEVKDMSTGKVFMREERYLMFDDEECFLIPSGQFGKILSQLHANLVEKGVTDGEEKRKDPKDGDPFIN